MISCFKNTKWTVFVNVPKKDKVFFSFLGTNYESTMAKVMYRRAVKRPEQDKHECVSVHMNLLEPMCDMIFVGKLDRSK